MRKIEINKEWLEKELKTKTPTDISVELNCHVETIRRKLRAFNIKRSRHSHLINEDYFKNWSSNMAYILGFTFADGCINRSLHHNKLAYQLQIKDIEILNFIVSEIQPSRNIYEYKKTNNTTGVISDCCVVDFSSRVLTQDLINLGCLENKTHKEISVPKIPKEFFGDFLRGLFDGDGSINHCPRKDSKYTRVGCSITNNCVFFLEQIREILGFGNISTSGTPTIKFYSKQDIKRFYNTLYSDENSFKLERKYNKFNEVFKIWQIKI